MDRVLIAFVALGLAAAGDVHAQTRQGSQRHAPPAPAHAPRTVPPPIVYPLPPLTTLPAGGLTPRFDNRAFRPDAPRRRQYPSSGYAPFFLGPGYGDFYAPDAAATAAAPLPVRATGFLQLAVTPADAQVYVDGLYVGTVDDINAKRELQLEAGPHRVEIRATFHQPLVVDVRIAPNETVIYRGTLDTVRPMPAPQAARAGGNPSDKIYLIPNCYLGNVPPRANRLPAGCDVKHVQVVPQK